MVGNTLGDDDVLFVFERKGIRVTKNSWVLADVWYPLISGWGIFISRCQDKHIVEKDQATKIWRKKKQNQIKSNKKITVPVDSYSFPINPSVLVTRVSTIFPAVPRFGKPTHLLRQTKFQPVSPFSGPAWQRGRWQVWNKCWSTWRRYGTVPDFLRRFFHGLAFQP